MRAKVIGLLVVLTCAMLAWNDVRVGDDPPDPCVPHCLR